MFRRPPIAAAASAALLALAVAALTGRARAASLAMLEGEGATGIQMVNLDLSHGAGVLADHYPHHVAGWTPVPNIQVSRPGIPPGGSSNFYLPSWPDMPRTIYGVVLGSDRAIGAVVRTDWTNTNASMLYNAMRPATDVVVPLYVKRALGQDGAIAVMLGGDAAADVELTLWRADGELALRETYAFEAHEPRILPLHASSPPGIGFVGWASLHTTASLAAAGLVDVRWSRQGAYAYEGVPVERVDHTLYVPFIRRAQRGDLPETVTTLWLTNPTDRTTSFTVRYDGNTGSCAGRSYVDGPRVVAPHAMARIDPRAGDALPANCVASAMVVADGAVAAVAVDAVEGGAQVAAYTAMGAVDAAVRVALPMVRRRHTAMDFTTAIAVQNAAAVPANVQLEFRDQLGITLTSCGDACRVVIAPGAGHLFFPSSALNGMPVGSYGSATITSDQPVVAVVDDASGNGAADASIYSGIPWPADAQVGPLLAPFVLNGAAVDFSPSVMQRFFPWGGTGR